MIEGFVRRLRARSPVVPRATRDQLRADHDQLRADFGDLQRRHDALQAHSLELNHHHVDLQRRHEALEHQHHDTNQRFLDLGGGDAETEPFLRFAKPGHFYSPIPVMSEALENVGRSFDEQGSAIPAVDLRLDSQLELAARLARLHEDVDDGRDSGRSRRYTTENPSYGWGDALVLESMLREFAPRRIVEIGSGFSSALMLDVIEAYRDDPVSVTFIEPFAEVLRGLLRAGDTDRCEIIEQPLQAVDAGRFEELESGDLLFIDSTHVVRPGSDVLLEILEILPRLRPGVLVHVHDIFYPFEYPVAWVAEGRVWGEAYLLRAFLAFNSEFEIILWPHYLNVAASEALARVWPAMVGVASGAIWLRRRN